MNATSSATGMKPSGSSPSYSSPGRRVSQLGVSRRSESHRSVFHVLATSPRSRTTCSIDSSDNTRLTARPECPAPTMTTGMRSTALIDGHRDVGGVRQRVEHGRALLRLGDERGDLVGVGVRVDLEVHADVLVAVAHLG